MLSLMVFGMETRLVVVLKAFFFFGFSRSAYREVDLRTFRSECVHVRTHDCGGVEHNEHQILSSCSASFVFVERRMRMRSNPP